MELDWKSIAGAVAPLAPKLGAVLGAGFGPVGSVVGGLAGSAIAAAFGVEANPKAVGEAIAKDRNAVEKLRILEETRGQEILAQAQIKIEQLKSDARQAESIGRTQIAEQHAGVSWWHWRHLLGYVTVLFGLVLVIGFAMALFGLVSMADYTAALTQATIVFGILATLNGYVASDTTSRVQSALEALK